MVSGQLEDSLRHEIESYIEGRIGGIKQEIAALQSQLNESMTRLLDRQGEVQLDGGVAASILEHLRTAHEEGIDLAASESSRAKASSEMAIVKAAIAEIEQQKSQADILKILVNRSSAFAPRVAFFVVKGDQSIGWRARGFQGTVGDNAIHQLAFPVAADTAVGNAIRSRETWSGGPGSNAENHLLLNRFGGDPPARIVSVPLVVRDRAVAVLYADSAGLDSEAINLEALETLVRVAGMAVDLLAARSAPVQEPEPKTEASAEQVAQPEPRGYTPVAEYGEMTPVIEESAPAAEVHGITEEATEHVKDWIQPAPVETAPESKPEQMETAPAQSDLEAPTGQERYGRFEVTPAAAQSDVEATPVQERYGQFEATPTAAQSDVEATPAQERYGQFEVTPTAAQSDVEAPPVQERYGQFEATPKAERMPATSEPAQFQPERAAFEFPADASSIPVMPQSVIPAAPRRRYGTDVDLPVEVSSEEERRLHNDARRFARLLVSEIKLYNEQKVAEGRSQNDLYLRLREYIDRSREMYAKRVRPEVAQRYDYFHHELINTLADGDIAKLGREYPGQVVSA